MKTWDIYFNGLWFDSIYFASRKTMDQVLYYVRTELKLTGNVSVTSPDSGE